MEFVQKRQFVALEESSVMPGLRFATFMTLSIQLNMSMSIQTMSLIVKRKTTHLYA